MHLGMLPYSLAIEANLLESPLIVFPGSKVEGHPPNKPSRLETGASNHEKG